MRVSSISRDLRASVAFSLELRDDEVVDAPPDEELDEGAWDGAFAAPPPLLAPTDPIDPGAIMGTDEWSEAGEGDGSATD